MNMLAVPVEFLCFSDDMKHKEEAILRMCFVFYIPVYPLFLLLNN